MARVKLCYTKSEEVAHIFANVSTQQKEAYCNNTHIRLPNDDLSYYYSYNTIISIRDVKANLYLISTQSYSVTTSKQQSELSGAIWADKIYVPNVNDGLETNFEQFNSELNSLCKKHVKARIRDYKDEILALYSNMIKYLEYKKVDKRKYKKYFSLNKNFDLILGYYSNMDELDKKELIKKQKRIKKAFEIEKKNFIKTFDIEKYNRYYEALPKLFNSNHIKSFRKVKDFIKSDIQDIKRFKLLEFKDIEYKDYTYLRLESDFVKTSQNIKLSLKECKILWNAIQSNKDITNYNIDGYKINTFNDDVLIAGCHTIQTKEIKRVGKLIA